MNPLNTLSPEDYLEPECPLCMEPADQDYDVVPVPQQRIKDRLDLEALTLFLSHRRKVRVNPN